MSILIPDLISDFASDDRAVSATADQLTSGILSLFTPTAAIVMDETSGHWAKRVKLLEPAQVSNGDGVAAIGKLEDVVAILGQNAGTCISADRA